MYGADLIGLRGNASKGIIFISGLLSRRVLRFRKQACRIVGIAADCPDGVLLFGQVPPAVILVGCGSAHGICDAFKIADRIIGELHRRVLAVDGFRDLPQAVVGIDCRLLLFAAGDGHSRDLPFGVVSGIGEVAKGICHCDRTSEKVIGRLLYYYTISILDPGIVILCVIAVCDGIPHRVGGLYDVVRAVIGERRGASVRQGKVGQPPPSIVGIGSGIAEGIRLGKDMPFRVIGVGGHIPHRVGDR